jgi:hypothetical protein
MSRARRLTLVDQIDLGRDDEYDGLTLRNFSAGGPIVAQLLDGQIQENEVIAIVSADGQRCRLVADLAGVGGVFLPRIDPAQKWSIGLKVNEFLRGIVDGHARIRERLEEARDRIIRSMAKSEVMKAARKSKRRIRKRSYEQ